MNAAELAANPQFSRWFLQDLNIKPVLPLDDQTFDGVCLCVSVQYLQRPVEVFHEVARVLRPGGRIDSLEFGVPARAGARAAWRFYTAVGLPVLGGLFSQEWREVGRFLGPSIRGFYERHPLPAIVGYWQQAGLVDVSVRRMSLGGGVVMSASRARGSEQARGRDGARPEG